MSWFIKFDKLI